MYRYFYVAFMIIVLGGCQLKHDIEGEKSLLLDTDKKFAQTSISEGAAEAFRVFLDSSAVQFPSGKDPVFGRDSIYVAMKGSDRGYTLSWEPQFAEVSASGDLGWTWGNYTIVVVRDGRIKKSFGKYVNVWKKQSDRSWKVIADIGNESPERK